MSLDLHWSDDGVRILPTIEDARIQERNIRRVLRWCIDDRADAAHTLAALRNACLDYIVYPPSGGKVESLLQKRRTRDLHFNADVADPKRAESVLISTISAVPGILPR